IFLISGVDAKFLKDKLSGSGSRFVEIPLPLLNNLNINYASDLTIDLLKRRGIIIYYVDDGLILLFEMCGGHPRYIEFALCVYSHYPNQPEEKRKIILNNL